MAAFWMLFCVITLAAPALGAAGPSSEGPRIGLALSGGGARGAAHIGVLRALEEQRIPIDYIAGTSMGSIIGGLYASGMSPDEIERALGSMDWKHIFSDEPPRQERSFRRKRDDDLYLVKAKPGISDEGELKFPTGAIQGQKFDLALRQLTLSVSSETDFDHLRIPFRAVASDLATGTAVVIGSGDLATAMRASMSVPGAFAATEINGRLLVDGGITNNLPIDVVRDMGADIVIAVDISTPYMPAEEVDNLFSITAQLTSIMTRTNADRQIASLTERDILIIPELGDITSGDFESALKAIPRGREAAEAKRDRLAMLALSDSDYQIYQGPQRTASDHQMPVVSFIRIENDSTIDDSMIRDRLNQRIGAPLDRLQLERDIGNIYGLELFQTVHYDLVEENDKVGLVVNARARSWGPNYLQFGMKLSGDFQGDNAYDLGLAYLRTGINPLGGEIRTGLQLGEESSIIGGWYQPLDSLSRFFINTRLGYDARNVNLFSSEDGRLAEFRVQRVLFDVAVGREISVYGEGRLGYRYHTGEVDLITGTPGWPEFSFDTALLYGRLSVDRLDNYNFPEDGWLATLEYASAREAWGSDEDFDQLALRGNRFTTFGKGHVLGIGGLLETTPDGDTPIQDRYRLGGFLNLSGFADNALSGQQAAVVAAIYYRRFELMPFLSWYVGGSLEYGGVWEETDDIGNDSIAAGSLFLGADTPIGPVYLGLGKAEGGHSAAFFYLGRPLFH
ncbi:patatin-like phospholipase family protein [Marinobacterium arenosum]|uniref:patatin-like phospholipase family protein n=1 Tax=Marinobacterium arenosum TaxID=2862496 RepID=UPI0021060E90|nr:patatin-like phospholipase family protein [Marinobacterium arenosum]